MSIAKYPTYKETGLKWLEVIPSHWEVRRLKQFCDVFPSNVDKKSVEGETQVRLCNYTDVYYNDIVAESLEFMAATATEEQIGKFNLKAGDTIITKDSETADDIAIAAYVPQDLPGVICGYHLSMVRPKKAVYGAFVKRLFDSIYTKSLMAVSANGLTRVGLSQYTIDNVELPLPPKNEQAEIATFLDRETTKIDALIAEQKRLIELLQEKRQAVISHAVTKGLNPNAPMKDSGVEWLGDVPEHWAISPIKYFARVGNGSTPNRENLEYWADDGFPWLNSSVVNQAEVLEAERFVTKLALKECHLPIVKPPAALVGITGQGRTRGMAAQLMFTATVNQHVAFIMPSTNRITVNYLLRVLEASYDRLRLDSEGSGSTKGAITCEQLGLWCVPLPDHLEQEEIVSFLKVEVEMHESLKAESERAIQLLQERRSTLISAAVTGQIDVRGLVEAEACEQ